MPKRLPLLLVALLLLGPLTALGNVTATCEQVGAPTAAARSFEPLAAEPCKLPPGDDCCHLQSPVADPAMRAAVTQPWQPLTPDAVLAATATPRVLAGDGLVAVMGSRDLPPERTPLFIQNRALLI